MSRWHPHQSSRQRPSIHRMPALFTPAEQPLAEPAGASAAAEEPATAEGAILAAAAVASAIESSKVEMEHKEAAVCGSSSCARELRLPPYNLPASLLSRRPTEGCRLYNRSRMFLRARH